MESPLTETMEEITKMAEEEVAPKPRSKAKAKPKAKPKAEPKPKDDIPKVKEDPKTSEEDNKKKSGDITKRLVKSFVSFAKDKFSDPSALEKDLLEDELFIDDISRLVEKVLPYIPFTGVLTGGATIFRHYMSGESGDSPNEDQDKQASKPDHVPESS